MKVLRHPPPLLLLGQHQRRRERPPLALLAPKVGQQPRVGQRHRGLVGQPAEALDVVPVEGVAGCPRQRDGADGQVAPVGRRHGHGHLAHPRQGATLRGGDGQPLGGREQIAAGAVVRRRHDAVLPVAQHQDGGVGADQPPRLGHDGAVGVLLVQRAGHPPCHLGQGGELTHLPVQLARPILHTGEKLTRPQLESQDLGDRPGAGALLVAHRPPARQHQGEGPHRDAARARRHHHASVEAADGQLARRSREARAHGVAAGLQGGDEGRLPIRAQRLGRRRRCRPDGAEREGPVGAGHVDRRQAGPEALGDPLEHRLQGGVEGAAPLGRGADDRHDVEDDVPRVGGGGHD